MKRISLMILLVVFAGAAQAFELNINKLVDALGKVKDLKPVDDKGEAEIGSGVAANLLGAAPLVQDEKLQAYVSRLGWWLALQTERADLA
jgi:predicted Zn-dependent protease